MKPACGSIREWLGAYADKELDSARADQVGRHLETCADCRRELAEIQELHRLASSVEHPRLADDYWDWHRARVWRGIRGQRREVMPRFRPSFMWAKLATVAAGLAVVLVLVVSGWRMFGERPLVTGKGVVAERALTEQHALPPTATGKTPTTVTAEEKATTAEVRREEARFSAGGGAAGGARAAGKADKAASGSAGTNDVVRTRSEPSVAHATAADEVERLPATPPVAGKSAGFKAKVRESIVNGPVLLESPPMSDLDALDTGTVLLSVRTDTVGRVLSAAVRRSSGSAQLDSVAVRQIRGSRFKAAVRDNRGVSSSFEYPYRFQKKQVKPPAQQKQQDNDSQPDKQQDQKQKPKPKIKDKTNK